MALEGSSSVGEMVRVKCLFCPQWTEGDKLSDHLKDFHRSDLFNSLKLVTILVVDLLSFIEIFISLCDPLNTYDELVNIFFGLLSSDELANILVLRALESLSTSF